MAKLSCLSVFAITVAAKSISFIGIFALPHFLRSPRRPVPTYIYSLCAGSALRYPVPPRLLLCSAYNTCNAYLQLQFSARHSSSSCSLLPLSLTPVANSQGVMYVGCVRDKATDRILNNMYRCGDMTIEVRTGVWMNMCLTTSIPRTTICITFLKMNRSVPCLPHSPLCGVRVNWNHRSN